MPECIPSNKNTRGNIATPYTLTVDYEKLKIMVQTVDELSSLELGSRNCENHFEGVKWVYSIKAKHDFVYTTFRFLFNKK